MVHEYFLHSGIDKTYRLLTEKFVCSGLRKKVLNVVRSCHCCQINKPGKIIKSRHAVIQSSKPLDTVCVDYLGPYPATTMGYRYILVMVDSFTRLVRLYPTSSATSQQALSAVKNYVREMGTPHKVLSDNGTHFRSKTWIKGLQNLHIKPHFTAIRRPQQNLSERVNNEIVKYLRICAGNRQEQWARYLADIENNINLTYNASIKMTPHEAHFNQVPLRPWAMLPCYEPPLRITMDERIDQVRDNLRKRMITLQDRNANRAPLKKFRIGELVLVKSKVQIKPGIKKTPKLCPKYNGPFRISDVLGTSTYAVAKNDA
ncbi:unnamed protein product, partial [Nesidiocoris tenuis]